MCVVDVLTQNKQAMVNKFGDSTNVDSDFFNNLQVIRKITVTSGKFEDFCEEILTSIQLGFSPYRISASSTSPSTKLEATNVYVYENKVWCLGSRGKVTELVSK